MDISQKDDNNGNIGLCNRGFYNHGNCNNGSWNTSNHNNGWYNSGTWNNGSCNSGSQNSGDINTGNYNSGDYNSGDNNVGVGNSGNNNTGNWNSGDFNFTNGSNGCFNTTEPTISFFNQPSDWTQSQWWDSAACAILRRICAHPVKWVVLHDMTKAEKKKHPECEVVKGWLQPLSRKEQRAHAVKNWKRLSEEEKRVVMAIPNFDAAIFKQITGIDVDRD